MKIVVVGTGYEGLVVGTGLAENGHHVTCVDRDEARIEGLRAGKSPMHEVGLEELLIRNIEEERLLFTSDLEGAVADCLLIFLCVGTPALEDGQADVSDVLDSAERIGRAMTGYRIIANATTCPPGTAERIRDVVAGLTSHDFDVVVNPSFMKKSTAVDDFLRPDRVVVGCEDVRVETIMKELYAPFLRTGKPLLTMGLRSAEMAKYAVSVMLATRISFINELASLCETLRADIGEVREALATDSRIGPAYIFPGLGFGGPGLPKDLQAILHMAKSNGLDCALFDAVDHVNRRQLERFIGKILGYYGASISEKRIALWGASFKARTPDLRRAPALRIVDALLDVSAQVAIYDPVAAPELAELYGDAVQVVAKNYDALEGADGLVVATEWREFHRPDYERMGVLMREKVIFDGRNLYTPAVLKEHGFRYFSVGRPSV